jgi:predicted phosphodiesterase
MPHREATVSPAFTPENHLLPAFAGIKVSIVVCGHTHMQFDRTIRNVHGLNAGSVGMPVGKPGAYWLGPEVRLRHTLYDLSKAAERIQATKYPEAHDFAAGSVLAPIRR